MLPETLIQLVHINPLPCVLSWLEEAFVLQGMLRLKVPKFVFKINLLLYQFFALSGMSYCRNIIDICNLVDILFYHLLLCAQMNCKCSSLAQEALCDSWCHRPLPLCPQKHPFRTIFPVMKPTISNMVSSDIIYTQLLPASSITLCEFSPLCSFENKMVIGIIWSPCFGPILFKRKKQLAKLSSALCLAAWSLINTSRSPRYLNCRNWNSPQLCATFCHLYSTLWLYFPPFYRIRPFLSLVVCLHLFAWWHWMIYDPTFLMGYCPDRSIHSKRTIMFFQIPALYWSVVLLHPPQYPLDWASAYDEILIFIVGGGKWIVSGQK